MSMPLPSGIELTALVAAAVLLSLAAMWLTRVAGQIIGYDNSPADRPSRIATDYPKSLQLNHRSTIAAPVALAANGWATWWKALAARLSALLGKLALRNSLAAGHSQHVPVAAPVAGTAPPQRLTIDAQWERATIVVDHALSCARTIRSAHIAASEKLDAAHYALDKLMIEIEGIISLNVPRTEVAVLTRASNVVNLHKATALATRRAAAA